MSERFEYLCYAYGESDLPCCAIVPDRAGVQAFLITEWFGDALDPDLPIAMERFDANDWSEEPEMEWEFEIGGVRISRVFRTPTAREPVMVAEARKPCGDPDCTCHVPTFTDPLQALRFLSGRFKFAGVDHAVAVEYARDIDAILAAVPAKVTEAMVKAACDAYDKNSIPPLAEVDDCASYQGMHAALTAALATVQPAEPGAGHLAALVEVFIEAYGGDPRDGWHDDAVRAGIVAVLKHRNAEGC